MFGNKKKGKRKSSISYKKKVSYYNKILETSKSNRNTCLKNIAVGFIDGSFGKMIINGFEVCYLQARIFKNRHKRNQCTREWKRIEKNMKKVVQKRVHLSKKKHPK